MANNKLLTELTKYGDSYSRLNDVLYYASDRTVEQYKKMRKYPMCWMGLNFIKLGLPDVPFVLECDDKKIKSITEKMLKKVWKKLMREALEKVDFGFKAMELRYEKGKLNYLDENDNKETFEGVLFRSPKGLDGETIDILIEKEDGSFRGFRQNSEIDVLVKDRKALLFTHNLESGQYYGISSLEPIFPFWYDANLNRQFHMRWLERKGTGFFKGIYPTGTKKLSEGEMDNQDIMLNLLDSIVEGNVVSIPSSRDDKGNLLWDIQFMSDEDKTDPFIARQKHIDEMILKGLVIPEKALTQGEIGARSSIEAFQDMFVQLKQEILDVTVDTIDKYMLPNFIELNFGKDIEIHVSAGKLDDNSKETAGKIVETLLQKDKIGIQQQWIIDKTGIPLEEKEPEIIEKDIENEGSLEEKTIAEENGIEGQQKKEENKNQEDPKKIETQKMSDTGRWRAFDNFEKKFNLAALDSELDRLSASFKSQMTEEIKKQTDRITRFIDKNYTGDAKGIDLARKIEVKKNSIKKIIRIYLEDVYKHAYEMVKFGVENRVNFAASDPYSQFIVFRAETTSDKFVTDLESEIKFMVSSDAASQRSKPELIDRLTFAIDAFLNRKIDNTANTELGFILGKGIEDYIQENKKAITKGTIDQTKEIQRVRYSAILDSRVCGYCKELDGLVTTVGSAVYRRFDTPGHFSCRCVWLPITKEEIDNPRIEGTNLTLNNKGKQITVDDMIQKIGPDINLRTFSDFGLCNET
jgi:SPP1 gp7 family putative phage head morphogenesis protein